MTGITTSLRPRIREFARDTRGVAAIEFALGTLMLAVGLLNVADIGLYIYTRMEVDYASQMGAQAAWKTCNDQTTMLPATQNCTGLNTAITTSIQSTTLGALCPCAPARRRRTTIASTHRMPCRWLGRSTARLRIARRQAIQGFFPVTACWCR
jgi:Flp pilus assembly protein TadG